MSENVVHKFAADKPRMGTKDFSHILVQPKIFDSLDMDNKKAVKIWEAIAETIKKEVCENPLGFKAPFYLGEWKIQYLPYKKNKNEDAKSSSEVGEPVPYVNIHSKGKDGKLVWERKAARKFNKVLDLYAFEPSDLFRDMVSKVLRETPDKFRISRVRVINKPK